MNTQKLKNTSIIAALAIATIALVVGLSQTQATTAQTAPQGNNVYVFGEGVSPQATFTLAGHEETADFQIFTQTQGFENNGRGSTPEFTLIKISGGTPYLYAATDVVHANGIDSRVGGEYLDFPVTVKLMQAGEPVRVLKYNGCNIVNYKINTRTDNEEGYTSGGKAGFAVTDEFTFGCAGYSLGNPAMDAIIKEEQNRKPYQ